MTFIVTLLFSVALSSLFVGSYSCLAAVECSHGNCTIWCIYSAPLHRQYAQSMIAVCGCMYVGGEQPSLHCMHRLNSTHIYYASTVESLNKSQETLKEALVVAVHMKCVRKLFKNSKRM